MAPPPRRNRCSIIAHAPSSRRGDRGAALVELALLLPFLSIVVFGTVDVGRAFSLQNRLTNMAREGAFYAQYYPTNIAGCPGGSITAAAVNEDPTLSSAIVAVTDASTGIPITNSCGASPVPGTRIRVRVTSQMSVLTPLVGGLIGDPVTIGSSTEVVVQGLQA